MQKYISPKEKFIERKEYNNVITVKLVIPTMCNAACPFCYNKDKDMLCDKRIFLAKFMASLNDILDKIGDQNPVSVDITGGEPTLDVPLIKEVLEQLKENNIHERVVRITMTTNGIHLADIADDIQGVVDYINISVHDYIDDHRRAILGTNAYLTKEQYTDMVEKVKVPCSVTSVLYKDIENFALWRDNFIAWAKEVGFIAIRFRYCNGTYCNGSNFDEYMLTSKEDPQFKVITYEHTPDSHWCRLRRYDGFRVFFLHGVLDTSLYSKGIEYIIDNDGHCYCDYYKRTPIEDYTYCVGKIYDREE